MPTRPRRPILRVLAIVLAVALVLVLGGFAWRFVTTRPAGEPQAVELTDATLSKTLTSATVLAVGEATHGTAEFQQVRQQVLAKVVADGFTTVALEDSAGTATQVDAWLQGCAGTAEEAAKRFGYGIYHTRQMADLLTWIRDYNKSTPAERRIRLYGIDVQPPEADKQVVLRWLAKRDADAAASFTERLSTFDNDSLYDKNAAVAAAPVAAELATVVEKAAAGRSDDATLRARLSARALAHGATYATGSRQGDARDRLLADQLAWLVERRAEVGAKHTLLLAHNGHVDRAGQATAVPGETLGSLSAKRWGDAYRAIGTDGHHVELSSDDQTIRVSVDSPVRGLFAGTRVGYLEMAAASPANRQVLDRSMPMVSAGVPFPAWYTWLPMLHSVKVTPNQAWDALIYVEDGTPTTPVG